MKEQLSSGPRNRSQVEAIVEAIDAAKPTATQRRVASKCARAVESIANVTAGRPVGRHVVDLDARTRCGCGY